MSCLDPKDKKNPDLLLYLSRRVSSTSAYRQQITRQVAVRMELLQCRLHFPHLHLRYQHYYFVIYSHLDRQELVVQGLRVVSASPALAERLQAAGPRNLQISSRQ